ncbi:hypothetical protein DSO57_1006519 [Entomophthora muscae]|uniref:Uncharacterized protein n=1 Tax=Entomophthora muscae TaxID=34485 RepID=A0ACC2S9H8_9FUNG|nr:hypothetical protein DSO57_1006519 [Entomophthora muscae]
METETSSEQVKPSEPVLFTLSEKDFTSDAPVAPSADDEIVPTDATVDAVSGML